MSRVFDSFVLKSYQDGEEIVREGDPSEEFFRIESGVIEIFIGDQLKRTLHKWDYFGERGLLFSENRSATCRARGPVTCYVLKSNDFLGIVGSFRETLMKRIALQDDQIEMADLEASFLVGEGGCGSVYRVHAKKHPETVYALKTLDKAKNEELGNMACLQVEREVLLLCHHPCLIHFIKSFQDAQNIYLLTEFLGGGDLFFVMREIGDLNKEEAQFFIGSMTLGVAYLHEIGYMYRDLKPENVLLDVEGWCKLGDFGGCRKGPRASTFVGTAEYLAPEVLCHQGYTYAVDWWSLGVVSYELILGPLPWQSRDHLELFKEILSAPISFGNSDAATRSLLEGMIERDVAKRFKSKHIMSQPYFEGFSFQDLLTHNMQPPWQPDQQSLESTWQRATLPRFVPYTPPADAWFAGF